MIFCLKVGLMILLVGTNGVVAGRIAIIPIHGPDEGWLQRLSFKRYVESKTAIPVQLLDAFNYTSSEAPLDFQVKAILPRMKRIAAKYDVIIAVGYSQGGVIWRAIIEEWDDHNVDMFIAIASPQHSEYQQGSLLSEYISNFIDWYSRTTIYKLISYCFERCSALFNYYLDPTPCDMYLRKCPFLFKVNNEQGSVFFGTSTEKRRHISNFLQLRRIVLVGGPGYEDPWHSTQLVILHQQDLLGLKILEKRGGVVRCTDDGPTHAQYRDNKAILDKCVNHNLREYVQSLIKGIV